MSVEETAEPLDIMPQTVKTRLHRAPALLKREKEKHIDPIVGDAFPFAGRRCERLTDRVLARLSPDSWEPFGCGSIQCLAGEFEPA